MVYIMFTYSNTLTINSRNTINKIIIIIIIIIRIGVLTS